MVIDENMKVMMDEKREQEILKEAADKKARAELIRARQQKEMDKIKQKKQAAENKALEEERRAQN